MTSGLPNCGWCGKIITPHHGVATLHGEHYHPGECVRKEANLKRRAKMRKLVRPAAPPDAPKLPRVAESLRGTYLDHAHASTFATKHGALTIVESEERYSNPISEGAAYEMAYGPTPIDDRQVSA